MGEVGRPSPGCRIRLESWKEGGYMIDDAVGARGEILINSAQLSQGYFNCQGTCYIFLGTIQVSNSHILY